MKEIKNIDLPVDTGLQILGKKVNGLGEKVKKKILAISGSGITLTSNEKKYVAKVIRYLENRGISLKRTAIKISSQEREFLNFLGPLMTAGLPLIKSVLASLSKGVLLPLRLTAAEWATDVVIQKKVFGWGTTSINWNEETDHIMKIINSLEDAGLLIKGVSEAIQNEAKEQKDKFPSMLLGTLVTSLSANMLAVTLARWRND